MIINQLRHRIVLAGFLLPLLTLGIMEKAEAQSFPTKIIRIVVPTGPGSPPDVISRIIATELTESEGWRVVVENRPGAAQTIALADVLKQPADGHTLFPMTVGIMATPALLPNMNVRLDTDLAPVIKISKSYTALVSTPSLAVKSVSDLVATLKNQPDKLNISVGGIGTPSHLLAEVFKLQTGTRAAIVPYQQSQQRISDLLSGTTHFAFFNTPAVVNLVAAGKLRALAVTAPSRITAMENVPTIAEQGYPGLVVPGEDWVGFSVRSGTPNEIVTRLNQAINKCLIKPKVRSALASLGAEAVGGTSVEFGSLVKSQLAYWENVVRQTGIKMPQR